jgi:hypothetical protein
MARLDTPSPGPPASNQMPAASADVLNLPLAKGCDVLGSSRR